MSDAEKRAIVFSTNWLNKPITASGPALQIGARIIIDGCSPEPIPAGIGPPGSGGPRE